jgi:hypothetical protein
MIIRKKWKKGHGILNTPLLKQLFGAASRTLPTIKP